MKPTITTLADCIFHRDVFVSPRIFVILLVLIVVVIVSFHVWAKQSQNQIQSKSSKKKNIPAKEEKWKISQLPFDFNADLAAVWWFSFDAFPARHCHLVDIITLLRHCSSEQREKLWNRKQESTDGFSLFLSLSLLLPPHFSFLVVLCVCVCGKTENGFNGFDFSTWIFSSSVSSFRPAGWSPSSPPSVIVPFKLIALQRRMNGVGKNELSNTMKMFTFRNE